jgi:hypothetical protein
VSIWLITRRVENKPSTKTSRTLPTKLDAKSPSFDFTSFHNEFNTNYKSLFVR